MGKSKIGGTIWLIPVLMEQLNYALTFIGLTGPHVGAGLLCPTAARSESLESHKKTIQKAVGELAQLPVLQLLHRKLPGAEGRRR